MKNAFGRECQSKVPKNGMNASFDTAKSMKIGEVFRYSETYSPASPAHRRFTQLLPGNADLRQKVCSPDKGKCRCQGICWRRLR